MMHEQAERQTLNKDLIALTRDIAENARTQGNVTGLSFNQLFFGEPEP